MNKYLSLFLLAAAGFVFQSCEDVPAPYDLSQYQTSAPETDAKVIVSESFGSSLGSFSNETTSGAGAWACKYSCATAQGYNNTTKTTTAGTYYLVSSPINLTKATSAYISFDYLSAYLNNTDDQQVLIVAEDDYQGDGAAAQTSWTRLPVELKAQMSSVNYDLFEKALIQIPSEFLGKYVYVALYYTCGDSSASTWEVKNFAVKDGKVEDEAKTDDGGDTPTTPTDGTGSGTLADPYNVAAALSVAKAATTETAIVYIKGKVSEIKSIDTGQYGNAEYYISDDGSTTNQLLVYRGLGLNGAKFTSADALKVGDEVIIAGKLVNFKGNTPEVTQGSKIVNLNGEGEQPGPAPSGVGTGTGTQADPYNVAAALGIAQAATTETAIVYIKGKVSQIKSIDTSNYGNAEYYISDDGSTTNQLLVYRGLGLDGAKFTSADALKVGDEVIIAGKLVNFKGNTPEVTTGSKIISLNGQGGSTPTPTPTPTGEGTGTGTQADPYNVAAALGIAQAATTETAVVYIKGIISQIKNIDTGQYGNAEYYISDDGTTTNQLLVYRGLGLDGAKFTSANDIKVGDEVVIAGKLINFKGNTPEVNQGSKIVTLNSTSGGGGDDPTPTPTPSGDGLDLADFNNGGFEAWTGGVPDQWKSASTASNATLSQSTDAHNGSYAVLVQGASAANKRLASTELALEAGTYECTFWTKAATSSEASLCPGHAVIGTVKPSYYYDKAEDGEANKYVNNIGQEWQQVTFTFTLPSNSTVCLIVMNSKTTASDLLVDDFTITKK